MVGDGEREMHAADFASLAFGCWLSDAAIITFSKALLHELGTTAQRRCFIIDTQAIVKCRSEEGLQDLQEWYIGMEWYEFDYLIWPIHDGGHWMLSLAQLSTFEYTLIDPFFPQNGCAQRKSLLKIMRRGYQAIFAPFCVKYTVKMNWNYSARINGVQDLLLLAQPSGNTTDCGVLVCYYIWVVLTNRPLSSEVKNLTDVMAACRDNIGGIVAKWICTTTQ